MTVFELRQALLSCNQKSNVLITFNNEDERPARGIIADSYVVRIIDNVEEISVGERIIFTEGETQ